MPDRRSTGFQTYLERRFTPGRFFGDRLYGRFGNLRCLVFSRFPALRFVAVSPHRDS
jgi:hypothetical protein